jgi:hypothetical protein
MFFDPVDPAREAQMPQHRFTRPAALSGAVFVVLLNGALFAPGAPPKAHDSAARIASTLAGHRGVILAGLFVAGIALLFGLWFFSTVGLWLGTSGDCDTALTWAAVGGAIVATALLLVGMLLFYGATYKVAGQRELPTVRGLTDAGNATVEMSKFGLAFFVGGISWTARRSGLLPSAFTAAGGVSSIVAVASTIPLFAEGSFTQFGGGLDVIGGAPAILWILTLSILMARRAES